MVDNQQYMLYEVLNSTVLSIGERDETHKNKQEKTDVIRREDLKLVCFQYVW